MLHEGSEGSFDVRDQPLGPQPRRHALETGAATMSQPSSINRTASRTLVLAGVMSVPIGLLNLAFPPAVQPTAWGYPFDEGTLLLVSIALGIAHLLKAHGFVGLSRLEGGGAVLRWSMLAAALGFVVVAVCEGISASIAGVPIDSPVAVNLNNGYGVGSMLLAWGSVVGGTVIVRRKLLEGVGRWSVLLSGAFMIFVVTPALFTRGPLAYLALTVWSAFYIWIGRTLGRAEKG